jgi:histidinol-phosphate aminotransferase
MNRIEKLVRPKIASFVPYSSAREESGDIAGVFLDANENAMGSVLGRGLNRYPDPYQRELKEVLAKELSISPSSLYLGNGSDEAIDLLIRIFCEPNQDSVLIFPPTYGMYKVSSDINSVAVIEVPLNENFELMIEKALSSSSANTKLAFICSPNNPTGNAISLTQIEELLMRFPGLVVVDEAYIDFCPDKSALSFIEKYENLIILRTFSKAWGLAGIRLGFVIARPEVITFLNKVKFPYNVSTLTQEAALEAVSRTTEKNSLAFELIREREKLILSLTTLTIVENIFPTDANFLLVKFKDEKKVFRMLREEGIVVRDRGQVIGCEHCLRITVGLPKENDRLVNLLSKLEQ